VSDLGGCFGFDGEAITYEEWTHLFWNDSRVVAQTDITEDIYVSTVWLGLDFRLQLFGHVDRPPLIYETMVFGGELDRTGERYPNRVAALAGHDRWVAMTREVLPHDRHP
jgi:hypothetical protein